MGNTVVLDEKINAYSNTNYVVFNEGDQFVLNVGQFSPIVKQLYNKTNSNCAVYITAYNPFGMQQDSQSNLIANNRLYEELKIYASEIYQGAGADPEGLWPPEPSFLAIGVSLQIATIIGKKYRQDAILWVDEAGIPQLILLR